MKDVGHNVLVTVYVGLFVIVLSIPYLSVAYFGPLWSLASLLPTLFLGGLTGYGWNFKRGSETIRCGVAPVFGLLHPACLLALLIDDYRIVRHCAELPLSGGMAELSAYPERPVRFVSDCTGNSRSRHVVVDETMAELSLVVLRDGDGHTVELTEAAPSGDTIEA